LPHPTPLPRLLAPLLCFNSRAALIISHHPQGLCACYHWQSQFAPLNSHVGLIVLLRPTPLPRLFTPSLCFNSCTALIILLHPQGLCAHSQSWFAPFSSCTGLIILLHPTPLPPLSLSRLRFVLTHARALSTCFAHSPAPSPSHTLTLSHLSVRFRVQEYL